jgi:transcriptional regulator with XRE-family HTH domain
MSDRRTLSSSLSSRVIDYLIAKGFSQADVARLLGVSAAFISLVRSKERSFTLDHLESLAEALKVPLGSLFLSITPAPKNVTPQAAKLYELSEQIMKLGDQARAMRTKVGAGG